MWGFLLLASCAAISHAGGKFSGVGWGTFVGLMSFLVAAMFLLTSFLPRNAKLRDVLPGFADLLASALLAIFSLAAAASIGNGPARYWSCGFGARRMCGTFNLAVASAAMLFLSYLLGAALALLAMRRGEGVAVGRFGGGGAAAAGGPAGTLGGDVMAPQPPFTGAAAAVV